MSADPGWDRAATFVGEYSHGQRIAAQMVGQASETDPRSARIVASRRPRDPNVEGPGEPKPAGEIRWPA